MCIVHWISLQNGGGLKGRIVGGQELSFLRLVILTLLGNRVDGRITVGTNIT
jgi:hypothetical protein